MKKTLIAISVALFLISFTRCASPGNQSPETVLENFFEALGKNNIEKARKLATADSKATLDMMEMAEKKASGFDEYDKNKMEFSTAKIEGEKAIISVKDKKSGDNTNFLLKKENGSWKVVFNSSFVMQMLMEKAKKNGIEIPELNKVP